MDDIGLYLSELGDEGKSVGLNPSLQIVGIQLLVEHGAAVVELLQQNDAFALKTGILIFFCVETQIFMSFIKFLSLKIASS